MGSLIADPPTWTEDELPPARGRGGHAPSHYPITPARPTRPTAPRPAMARVAVIFTGGTISTAFDPVAGGNVPTLDGAAILARTPGLDAIADVVAIDRGGPRPAISRSRRSSTWPASLREALADPSVDGAVIVQGTDTIEETSFCWDLVLDGAKPVVVTGAMRASDEPGFDGPANLRDAVAVAAAPSMRGAGVVVCLAGTIEPADDVVKVHASALDTFASPNGGSLGRVDGGPAGVTLFRRRAGRRHVATAAGRRARPSHHRHRGDGRLAARRGRRRRRGRHRGRRDRRREHGSGDPCRRGTRDGRRDPGRPGEPLHRGASGHRLCVPWRERDVDPGGRLPVGHLCAVKARVALALGLGAGLDRDGLAALLADPLG